VTLNCFGQAATHYQITGTSSDDKPDPFWAIRSTSDKTKANVGLFTAKAESVEVFGWSGTPGPVQLFPDGASAVVASTGPLKPSGGASAVDASTEPSTPSGTPSGIDVVQPPAKKAKAETEAEKKAEKKAEKDAAKKAAIDSTKKATVAASACSSELPPPAAHNSTTSGDCSMGGLECAVSGAPILVNTCDLAAGVELRIYQAKVEKGPSKAKEIKTEDLIKKKMKKST
jgi:hypothetical protein